MKLPFAEELYRISNEQKTETYIIGGFLRDHLMGRESYDLDLVAELDPRSVGMSLADAVGGTYYDLNLEHATARVNLHWEDIFWQLDIGAVRGSSIHEDLKKRDFTVNAMALSIGDLVREANWMDGLLDPLGGRKDLERKLVRATGEEALLEDPLRMLRGIRFSSKLQFQIEEETLQMFRKHRNLLDRVAGERIKMEWGKLLEKESADYFALMKDLNFLEVIFPGLANALEESAHYASRGWDHALATLRHLEHFLHQLPFPAAWQGPLVRYLQEKLRGGWRRDQILKLAALLQNTFIDFPSEDMDKLGETYYEEADKKAEKFFRYTRRLRLSRQERNIIQSLAFFYLHPLLLYKNADRTGRTIYRFYRQLGRETPGVVLLSLAGHYASLDLSPGQAQSLPAAEGYRRFAYNLLSRFLIKESRYVHPPSLVTGNEIMSLLNIEESRLVGQILEVIAEAQAEGLIESREEAFRLAEEEYRRLSSKGR